MENLLHNKYVLYGGIGLAALVGFMLLRGSGGGSSAQGAMSYPTVVYGGGGAGSIDTSASGATDLNGASSGYTTGLDASTQALLNLQSHQFDMQNATANLQINSDKEVALAKINSDQTIASQADVAGIYAKTLTAAKGLGSINASISGFSTTPLTVSINQTGTVPTTRNRRGF